MHVLDALLSSSGVFPHQHQLSSHDPYLWQNLKYYRKDTPGCHGRVLKYREVSSGLDEGPEEEYGLIREDWGYNRVEMVLERGTIRWWEEE